MPIFTEESLAVALWILGGILTWLLTGLFGLYLTHCYRNDVRHDGVRTTPLTAKATVHIVLSGPIGIFLLCAIIIDRN